tara:strand:+ start:8381 stop:9091 length:711 start_codon:yes stop_codon:yes gene_type:complete
MMIYLVRKNKLFILCIAIFSFLAMSGCNITDYRLDEKSPTVSELRQTPTPTPKPYRTKPFEMRIDVNKTYLATIVTAKGDIVLELYPDKSPIAVNNFVALSQEGFYDNITFHRVIRNFVAQSGDPTGTGQGGPGYTIEDEYNDLSHETGVIAMANKAVTNSAGSQWYITLSPQPFLDTMENGEKKRCTLLGTHCHTVFGRVVEGFDDVVKKITYRDPSKAPNYQGDIIKTIIIEEK